MQTVLTPYITKYNKSAQKVPEERKLGGLQIKSRVIFHENPYFLRKRSRQKKNVFTVVFTITPRVHWASKSRESALCCQKAAGRGFAALPCVKE